MARVPARAPRLRRGRRPPLGRSRRPRETPVPERRGRHDPTAAWRLGQNLVVLHLHEVAVVVVAGWVRARPGRRGRGGGGGGAHQGGDQGGQRPPCAGRAPHSSTWLCCICMRSLWW